MTKTKIQNRIIGLEYVKGSALLQNSKNWREHPDNQSRALNTILAKVGVADALIGKKTKNGIQLLDGHMRAKEHPELTWPVLILDITEEEEKILLATYDNLGAMADVNEEKLDKLLSSIDFDQELKQTFQDMILPADFTLDDPPESVKKNADHLAEIKAMRAKGNESVIEKSDTEKYLIITFPSRQIKEKTLRQLGLPPDERYIAASSISLRPRRVMKALKAKDRNIKSAPPNKSGSHG